ncbi:Crp/Fnr family transcriptional regulator [Leptolyngbya sp. FACHB-17]|uniref:Crp/Fnr family transcriptional regulator n=1 Tax=unclassified Leptolyngbya TaxID=2650499 RepID=UPI001681234F|nr:Crp/Fnr family transcriptional regulator [Leptolyngbya sp. FACHB-17]MBD2080190.1 Crp/Fnr family transcriptional regulator [Leptolyngbya sp. FACHB-17]
MNFSDFDQLPAALQTVVTQQTLTIGQPLFHKGEPAEAVYAIQFGRIRLLHYTENGQIVNHYQVNPGELCAELVLFIDAYACSAIVEEPTQVLVFPKQAFLTALQQDSDLATAFMAQLAYRLHLTKTMLEVRGIRSARERVLHYLRFVIPTNQNSVCLEQPLKSIAFDLGISPEVLSRTLTQLETEGVILRDKRRITMLQ